MALIVGTSLADRLNGTALADRIRGLGGNDVITGGDGNDLLEGGLGNDQLRGGAGNDRLIGADGRDVLLGEIGNDRLEGGNGNDVVRGGSGNDILIGGDDADQLLGETGNDKVFAGAGDDSARGGSGNDVIRGEDGADYLSGELGRDILLGGRGADIFAIATLSGGVDRIDDFRVAEGDGLDLGRLLAAYDFGEDLGEFVRFRPVATGTFVEIDRNGGGNAFAKAAFLRGVELEGLGAARLGLEALPDRTVQVNVDQAGVPDSSGGPGSLSGDGRFVAYVTGDDNLPSDTNRANDIYVRDLLTDELFHVSTNEAGVGGNRGSAAIFTTPIISRDGGHVLFQSTSTNLDPDDIDGENDVFWKDWQGTGEILRVNEKADGSRFLISDPEMSGDGRFVFFETLESLAQGDGGDFDIYRWDSTTGDFLLVSTRANGAKFNSSSSDVQVSNDGQTIAITTLATNPTGDDAFVDFDVYVKSLGTGAVERITRAAGGGEPLTAGGQQADSSGTDISATGRFVVFQSDAVNLVNGDVDNGELHVWWHDRQTGATKRVSESAAGTPGNADHLDSLASVSADGRFVAFASRADNLVANDTNSITDIFVKDMTTGEIAFVNRNAAGQNNTGTGSELTARQRPQISDDGQFIVFDGSGHVLFAPNPLFPPPDLTGADLFA